MTHAECFVFDARAEGRLCPLVCVIQGFECYQGLWLLLKKGKFLREILLQGLWHPLGYVPGSCLCTAIDATGSMCPASGDVDCRTEMSWSSGTSKKAPVPASKPLMNDTMCQRMGG